MSGGEPSSIKRSTRCAARWPALSNRYEDRMEERFDFAVYGLVLQHTLFLFAPTNFSLYFVAPRKRLDVGNYVFTLLSAVRLV